MPGPSISGTPAPATAATRLRAYAGAGLMVAAATLVGLALAPRWGNSAVDLLYLPAVVGAALLGGLRPALMSALASALAYNFFFTAPHRTFRIDSPEDVVTVIVLFLVAVVSSQLAASARDQARIADAHAARNATIAGFARRLLSCAGTQDIAAVAADQLATLFHCNAILLSGTPEPRIIASAPAPVSLTPSDIAAAAVTLESGQRTGRSVTRANAADWQFHAISSDDQIIAAVGLARDDGAAPVSADQLSLVQNLLDQIALALERARLESEARDFAALRERDRIRTALVASIGQDLQPRLSSIIKTVGELRRGGSADKSLVASIGSEALKLDRYIANLVELGPATEQRPIEAAGVTIDLFRRAVARNGKDVHLTPKEYAILAELAKHPGRVLGHAHLLRTAWGPAQENQTEYLRVAIRSLRQKLERNPARPVLIVNEPAVGYRLAVAH